MKRLVAIVVMVAVALYSGDLFAVSWTDRMLSAIPGKTTAAARFTELKDRIADAISDGGNICLVIPSDCGEITFSEQIAITRNIKIKFGGSASLLKMGATGTIGHFRVTSGNTLELEGLNLCGGRSTTDGASIANYGTLVARRCKFNNNSHNGVGNAYGGAVACWADSRMYATNCLFTANKADGLQEAYGGAVSVRSARAEFNRCTFSANRLSGASGQKALGGAVYVAATSAPTEPNLICVNCMFDNNENALYFDDKAKAVLVYSTVVNNVTNGVNPQYAFTAAGNSKVCLLGDVFYGNMSKTGSLTTYQARAEGYSEIYRSGCLAYFSNGGDAVPETSSEFGPNNVPDSSHAGSYFWTKINNDKPLVETYTVSGLEQHFCAVRGEYNGIVYGTTNVVYHTRDWSSVGCTVPTKAKAAVRLWGSAELSDIKVREEYDVFQNSRKFNDSSYPVPYNIPGSYNLGRCQVKIIGNGGRLRLSGSPAEQVAYSQYSPCSSLSCSGASQWTNLCYHCVGFTNNFTGSSHALNYWDTTASAGRTYYTPMYPVTLYCKWEPNRYWIKYCTADGTGYWNYAYCTNGVNTVLKTLTDDSKTVFLGWSTKKNATVREYTCGQTVKDLLKSFTDDDGSSKSQVIELYAVTLSKSAPQVYNMYELNQAISKADDGAVITVHPGPSSGAYANFSSQQYTISGRSLTIRNTNDTQIVLGRYAPGEDRLFSVGSSGKLTLEGFTIQNGGKFNDTAKRWGGAIYNEGELTLRNCTFHNNSTTNGVEVDGSARGGAIYNASKDAVVHAENCRFDGNVCRSRSAAGGGAVYNAGGRLDFRRCTFVNNAVLKGESSGGEPIGGAIASVGADSYVTLVSCTFAQNTNALYFAGGNVALAHCTVAGNYASQTYYREAIDVTDACNLVLLNSVVVGNQSAASGSFGDGSQVYVYGSDNSLKAFYSVIGKTGGGATWDFDTASANEYLGYSGSYRADHYFDDAIYNDNRLPELRQTTVNGVEHRFYTTRGQLMKGKRVRANADGRQLGYTNATLGVVFPTRNVSAASTLTQHIGLQDQLGRVRNVSPFPDEDYRYAPGAVANFCTRFRYIGGGGGDTTKYSYGYTSPWGAAELETCNAYKPGYSFYAWATNTTDNLAPKGTVFMSKVKYPYSRFFDTGKVYYKDPVDLYPIWAPNSYTIAFDKNSSAASGSMASMTMKYDKPQPLPANSFTRTGYLVLGWNTKSDGTGTHYDGGATVANLTSVEYATVTLYAEWTPVSYNVRYHENNGSYTHTQDIPADYGTQVTIADLPWETHGRRFVGWNTKADGSGTLWQPGEKGSNFCTVQGAAFDLYALWLDESSLASVLGTALTFTTDGDGDWFGQSTLKLNGKDAVRTPALGDKEHASLKTTVPGRGTISFRYKVSCEDGYDGLRLYVDDTSTEIFLTGNEEGTKTYTITEAGTHVIEWCYEKDVSTYEGEDAAWINEIVWTPATVNLNFNGNGAAYETTSQVYNDGDKYGSFPAEPTRAGKKFAGWWTTPSGGGTQITTDTVCDSTIDNVFARWSDAELHTVYFEGNGATGGEMTEQTFDVGVSQALKANAFTRTGYTFLYWDVKGSTGTIWSDGANKSFSAPGTTTLVAHWNGNNAKINYDGNGATSGSMSVHNTQVGADTPLFFNMFQRAGYVFLGWSLEKDGPVAYADGAAFKVPVSFGGETGGTLYAQWQSYYTVQFNGNGQSSGTEPADITVEGLENAFAVPACDLQREGHDFLGWATAPSAAAAEFATGDVLDASDLGITESGDIAVLYAVWKAQVIPPVEIAVPVKVEGLKYNGAMQTGVNREAVLPAPVGTETAMAVGAYTAEYALPAGNYCWAGGSTENKTVSWEISPLEISAAGITVDAIPMQAGDGVTPVTPKPVLRFKGEELVEGADYYIAGYLENVLAGSGAKILVNGTGNFTGTRTITFAITVTEKAGVPVIDSFEPAAGTYERHDEPAMLKVLAHEKDGADLEYEWYYKDSEGMHVIDLAFAAENFISAEPERPNEIVLSPQFFGLKGAKDGDSFIFGCNVIGAEETKTVPFRVEQKDFTYKLTFRPNWEGTSNSPVSLVGTSDADVTMLPATTFPRTGWDFAGWKDEKGNDYAAGDTAKNLTSGGCEIFLDAQWTKADAGSFIVRFHENGGEAGTMADQFIPIGEATALSANQFTREGYKFDGWNVQADGSGVSYADGAMVLNLAAMNVYFELYAKWKERPAYATVSFVCTGADSGTEPSAIDFTPGDPVTFAETPTRDGYRCAGWSTTEDGAVEYATGSTQTFALEGGDELVLHAVWEEYVDSDRPHTFIDAEGYQLVYYRLGEKAVFAWWIYEHGPATVTKQIPDAIDGFDVVQAGKVGMGCGEQDDKLIVPESVTRIGRYAFWQSSTVYFTGNRPSIIVGGGSPDLDGTTLAEYGFSDAAQTLAYPADDTTWTDLVVGNARAVPYHLGVIEGADALGNPAGDTGFFFENESGKVDFAGSMSEYLGKFTLPAEIDGSFGTATVGGIDPSCYDPTVTEINWAADSVPPANIKDYFPNLVKITYPLENVENVSGVVIPGVTVVPDGAVPYFTIHFEPNGGEGTMPDYPIAIPTGYLPPNAFTYGTRVFLGWKDAAENEFSDCASVSSGSPGYFTLYAQWSEPVTPCTVTFDGNGATSGSMADQTIPQGFATELDENAFERAGCVFAGWSTVKDGALVYGNREAVTLSVAAITLYAVWNESATETYKVRFNRNTGTGTMPDQVFQVGVAQPLAVNVFEREGWAFAGWNTEPDGSGTYYTDAAVVLDLAVAGDVFMLYAQWSSTPPPPADSYTVVFNANGGSGTMAPQTIPADVRTAITANAFVYAGHVFLGWNTQPDGSGLPLIDGAEVKNLVGVGETVTIYAQWEEIPADAYIVVFMNGGEKIGEQAIGATEEKRLKNVWSMYHWDMLAAEFAGWSLAEDGDVDFTDAETVTRLAEAGEEVRLYAVWTDVALLNRYYRRDITELGAVLPPTGHKFTLKGEGLAKGLKIVQEKTSGKWIIEGVATELTSYYDAPMYVRVTDTTDSKNKVENLYALNLSVLDPGAEWVDAGYLNTFYAPYVLSDIWPEMDSTWTVTGLPAGLKYAKAATEVKATKTTGAYLAPAYSIHGTPTKAGVFTLKVVQPNAGGTNNKNTYLVELDVYGDEDATQFEDEAQTAITPIEIENAKSVAGLPTGLKFTAKAITDKTFGDIPANHVYGIPTKAGSYAVTVTEPVGNIKRVFLWNIINPDAPLFDLWAETRVDKYASKMETVPSGSAHKWTIDVPGEGKDKAKVTVSGLPAGLKLVQDKNTKEYTIEGVPTKTGNFIVTFKVVYKGVTTVVRKAYNVAGNPFVGTLRGKTNLSAKNGTARRLGTAEISMTANGSGKFILTEGKTKTTVSFKSYTFNWDGDAEIPLVVPPCAADKKLGFGNRYGTLVIRNVGTLMLGEVQFYDSEAADALAGDLISAYAQVKTFGLGIAYPATLTYCVNDEAMPFGTISVAINASKATAKVTGKLFDGTKISQTSLSMIRVADNGDEGDYQTAPLLVALKDKSFCRLSGFGVNDEGVVYGTVEILDDVGEVVPLTLDSKAEYLLGKKKLSEVLYGTGHCMDGEVHMVYPENPEINEGAGEELLSFTVDANGKVILRRQIGPAVFELAKISPTLAADAASVSFSYTDKNGDKAKYEFDLVWVGDSILRGMVKRSWKDAGKVARVAYGTVDMHGVAP